MFRKLKQKIIEEQQLQEALASTQVLWRRSLVPDPPGYWLGGRGKGGFFRDP